MTTGANGRVTGLELPASDLIGSIPPELARLSHLETLNLERNTLSGSIPSELGGLRSLRTLVLGVNDLTGSIPPELGDASSLEDLRLRRNELSGAIPPELGNLTNLRRLGLNQNLFTGSIPLGFLHLQRLRFFHFADNGGLCISGSAVFAEWLGRFDVYDGPLCNEGDREVLRALYEATGGTTWTGSDGWLGEGNLAEWHGVGTDSLGRVAEMDLSGNGLTGRLPASLAQLASMTSLQINGNAGLTGPLPLALSALSLQEFAYGGTDLCAPSDQAFRDWLAGISSHEGTGTECSPPSDREVLEILFDATGGTDWTNATSWLTDEPLGDWSGVTTDSDGRVVALELSGNNLSGGFPPEIADLDQLRELDLVFNRLTGPIPPRLGGLTKLTTLDIGPHQLTGPIPPELGDLSSLSFLYIGWSDLTGPIPAELGGVTGLRWLDLGANDMTGQVPTELGGLASLQLLHLDRNRLGGSIPPELGNLAQLETLSLRENELTGSLPPELGEMAALRLLYLGNNAGLSGALPSDLTGLAALDELHLTGTGLCAPTDEGFQKWLADVGLARVRPCGVDAVSSAYLTQAVQSTAIPVPLVAGRDALLRVFVTASSATDEGIPRVRATFYRDGLETHAVDIPGSSTPIPTTLADAEGSLAMSANVTIPGSVIQPGLEFVIEVDPDGTLDPGLGVASRIPETGRASVQVEAVPVLDLTVVPFLRAQDADSSIVEIARSMAADPDTDEMLADTRAMLPVHGLDVKAHEPILTSTTNVSRLIGETGLARRMEGGTGYYMGIMPERVVGGQSGIASLGGRVGFSVADPFVIAHELGHNLSLLHAPCGGAGGPDRAFPQENGSIGVWGYDARGGGALVAPHVRDVMSYCGPPRWISDFSFARALSHRVAREAGATAFAAGRLAAPRRTLVLWGGVDEQGSPFLEPSFVADALPSVPRAPGDYRLVGLTASGDELFSLSFDMEELADVDGWSFAFALPARDDWAGALESITLSGPEGTTTMDRTTDRPMAIVRDPDSGRLRGVLRGADALQARAIAGGLLEAADATGVAAELSGMAGSLEVLFSRGVPAAVERRR
ncbi:MAG: hypothetical protein F4187_04415 [Gemmatimonadetes bacterium]|nr:hypothetical protein [Gemmatimonadota bacterium]